MSTAEIPDAPHYDWCALNEPLGTRCDCPTGNPMPTTGPDQTMGEFLAYDPIAHARAQMAQEKADRRQLQAEGKCVSDEEIRRYGGHGYGLPRPFIFPTVPHPGGWGGYAD